MVNASVTTKAKQDKFISTGRGGAANFRKQSLTSGFSPQDASVSAFSDSGSGDAEIIIPARFTTGRGGAGNMRKASAGALPVNELPTLGATTRTYVSTGRGGAGNFKDKDGNAKGRSMSQGSLGSEQRSASFGAAADGRPSWAARVPKIDRDMDNAFDEEVFEEDGEPSAQSGGRELAARATTRRRSSAASASSQQSDSGSIRSSRTMPSSGANGGNFFSKMRRRLSSVSQAVDR